MTATRTIAMADGTEVDLNQCVARIPGTPLYVVARRAENGVWKAPQRRTGGKGFTYGSLTVCGDFGFCYRRRADALRKAREFYGAATRDVLLPMGDVRECAAKGGA